MDMVLWIILGLAAGYTASVAMHSQRTLAIDLILGVVGAVFGGVLMDIFGVRGLGGFNLYNIFVVALSAIVIIGVGKTMRNI